MPSPVDFKNWRFNPFTGVFHPTDIVDEIRVVEFHEEWNAYGIELNEAPQLFNLADLADNVEVFENITGGAEFTQVPRTTAPSTGEFRVDYDADTYFGTGRVEFNPADVGTEVRVTYKGLGTVVKDRYQLLQTTVIPTSVVVEGNLEVTDELSVQGAVEFLDILNVTGDALFESILDAISFRINGGQLIDEIVSTQGDSETKLITQKALQQGSFRIDYPAPWQGINILADFGISGQWSGIGFGNGVFIATAASGASRVMRSTDNGVTWAAVTPATTSLWNNAAYGGGAWIIVAGDGAINRSTDDGVTWSNITYPGGALLNVAFGNNVFIALRSTGDIIRSTDFGLTWSVVSTPISGWLGLGIAYGDGVWVAVATTSPGEYTMRSTDNGLTWTAVAASHDTQWSSVAFGNGVFVAASNASFDNAAPTLMRSTDLGLTWQPVGTVTSFQDLAFGDNIFVAQGKSQSGGSATNEVYGVSKNDGELWTGTAMPAFGNWIKLAFGNGFFVGVKPTGGIQVARVASSSL